MNSDDREIVIVGAGVIGLAIACKMQMAGRHAVLIDRNDPGSQCSFGNAGHIATEQITPLASPETLRHSLQYLFGRDSPLSIRWQYAHRILPWLARFTLASRKGPFERGTSALSSLLNPAHAALQTMLRDAGMPAMLKQAGHLLITEQQRSIAPLQEQLRFLNEHGVPCEWLDAPAARSHAPELTPSLKGALLFSSTGQVCDPYALCKGLAEQFQRAGGEILRGDVQHIAPDLAGSFRLECAGDTIACRKLVIAAGAWSGELAAQLGCRLPLDTERGYHVTATQWAGDFELPIASFERKTIMTPLDAGLRITGFVEFGGLELPPSPARLRTLQAHLQALLPDTEFSSTETWMGCRPSMPDHLPVIGPSPAYPNAIFAFGHQHLGLTLAGITAEIVDALLNNREPPLDIHPFRAERF